MFLYRCGPCVHNNDFIRAYRLVFQMYEIAQKTRLQGNIKAKKNK